MHFLVNHAQENMHHEVWRQQSAERFDAYRLLFRQLIRLLYNDANVEVLLSEDPSVAQEVRRERWRIEHSSMRPLLAPTATGGPGAVTRAGCGKQYRVPGPSW